MTRREALARDGDESFSKIDETDFYFLQDVG
jgi:hypothetical protein